MGIQKPEAEKEETRRLRKLRERLRRVSRSLAEFDERLQVIHADHTGSYRFFAGNPPLLRGDWARTDHSLQRIMQDAAAGCSVSAQWLEGNAEMRERIDRLRNTRPPERNPSYTGFGLNLTTAARLAKPRKGRDENVFREPHGLTTEDVARHITAAQERKAAKESELAARLADRKARTAYLLAEFRAEQMDG